VLAPFEYNPGRSLAEVLPRSFLLVVAVTADEVPPERRTSVRRPVGRHWRRDSSQRRLPVTRRLCRPRISPLQQRPDFPSNHLLTDLGDGFVMPQTLGW
jgi:hypothetical protein